MILSCNISVLSFLPPMGGNSDGGTHLPSHQPLENKQFPLWLWLGVGRRSLFAPTLIFLAFEGGGISFPPPSICMGEAVKETTPNNCAAAIAYPGMVLSKEYLFAGLTKLL